MIDSTPIRGKVARILTSREWALNIGQEAGVSVGMEFDVLYPKGEDITDPDTGEVLGSLRRPKVRVRVVQVKPRISLAETFRSHRINIGGTGINMPKTFSLTRLLMPPEWIERYETFKTTERA